MELKPERLAIREAIRNNPAMAAEMAQLIAEGKIGSTDELDPNEEIKIVCSPWAERSILGCVMDHCELCKAEIALAPSSQAMIMQHSGPVIAICMGCFNVHVLNGDIKPDPD